MDLNCGTEILKIEDYSFYYPEEQRAALAGVELSITNGEFILLCGKSGCGKSTLLRQLKKSLRPHGNRTGRILFEGKNIEETDQRTESSKIGFVMQNPDSQIVTDKVWHELAFGLESLGCDTTEIRLRVAEMATYFGIQNWFYKNVEELSGGQKQILNLASVMVMNPSLLILDEPTSQLDPVAASNFLQTLQKLNRDLGVTILMTEHRLEEVFPIVDKVAVMEAGRIIAYDKPAKIGIYLKKSGNEMFSAMPTPMRIYAEVLKDRENSDINDESCPLTVRDGRNWVNAFEKGRSKEGQTDLESQWQQTENGKIQNFNEKKNEKKKKAIVKGISSIELKDVWFRYDRNQPDVVKGLSMKVEKGEFYCILGGNGTGKSTALSLITGIQKPWRGKVFIEGKDIRKWQEKELYHGCLGVVPQNPQSLFVKKTVREELEEMIVYSDKKSLEKYVDDIACLTELTEFMERHPYDLSGGEQQRLALAKILLLRPQILLMDEPTKGMDAGFKNTFAGILEKMKLRGVTILMISHDIEFCAVHADKCSLFFDGGIVASAKPEIFFSKNNFYTTAANKMARNIYPEAVTTKDVVKCLTEK